MNISHLKSQLESNFKTDGEQTELLPHSHEYIFKLYLQTEADHLKNLGAEGSQLEAYSETLAEIQDKLVEFSARLSATTPDEVLMKTALWRRYTDQIDPFDPELTGDERLGHSIFMDLAKMCEREDVYTDRDREYLLNR